MHIKIPNEQTLEQVAKELLRCLVNIRYWEKRVSNEGGRECRVALKNWQERSDILLQNLEAYKSNIPNEAIIILNPEK